MKTLNRYEMHEGRDASPRRPDISEKRPYLGWLAIAALLLTGCMHPGPDDPARRGPFFTPPNHLGEPSMGGIRRVVVLPVWGGSTISPEAAAELDPILVGALQQAQRFEVVSYSREAARRKYRSEAFSSASALPQELLANLEREFAADAVLFVDVTVLSAYRPLALGLRAKLAASNGTRLVWMFDNVFSAEDPHVANSARNFYLDSDRRAPADLTHGVLQSPSRFATYAMTAMAATLPPVLPTPLPPAKAASKR